MDDLPLEGVEKLVEASVFHPSPCKRLKERVLRDAVHAAWQQKISHRMMAAVCGAGLLLGLGLFVVRIARTPAEPTEAAVPAAAATPAEAQPETTSAPAPTAGGSLGEGLFQSAPATDPASAGANQ
jgi:hypothetical protein